jgi:hypothetical protein
MRDLLAAIATVRAKLGTRAPAYHNACSEVFDLDRHFPQYPVEPVPACEAAR